MDLYLVKFSFIITDNIFIIILHLWITIKFNNYVSI